MEGWGKEDESRPILVLYSCVANNFVGRSRLFICGLALPCYIADGDALGQVAV